MPLYEYQCSKCGEKFEVIQKFSDEPLKRHKGCRGSVHRLISSPALHFKGSGWYVNDYAKGGAKTESTSDSKAEAKSEGDSKSSDSKSSESSSSDSKSFESKSSDSKSSDSKTSSSDTKSSSKESPPHSSKTDSKPAKKS
jgi:putative FmdB family regulatory protein